MPERPTLHVRIPPDPRYAQTVRGALAAFASLHGVEEVDQAALVSAVGEALANAIEHGTPEADIEVTVEIDPHLVSARVVDNGCGFGATPIGFAPLPEGYTERGRGIPIMQRSVDLCAVESLPGLGTTVTLGRFRRDTSRTNQERTTAS
jgi:anti-sigma regulatory factor (Ser/Thr protein kinase)